MTMEALLLGGAAVAAAYFLRPAARRRQLPQPPPPLPAVPSPSASDPSTIDFLHVDSLWEADSPAYASPLQERAWPRNRNFIAPDFSQYSLCVQQVSSVPAHSHEAPMSARPRAYLSAGPSPRLFFAPGAARIAIATCGGLCPGLNTVIREIVMCATYTYGLPEGSVLGVPGGYRGFYEGGSWTPLTPASVSRIHLAGGTVLGSSRGGFDAGRILAALARERIDIVVVVGGDGTHRGAAALSAAARAAGMRLSVAAVPKTVDDDLPVIDRSFGFETAVGEAVRVIDCAHTEAHSATAGVGLVKVMGREAGFLAMYASMASRDVNACLLPEAPWRLARLCEWLEARLKRAGHAVVVVAEGAESVERAAERAAARAAAGADAPPPRTDASGNAVLEDVGEYVKAGVAAHFKASGRTCNLKYIDPSYVIRAAPANAADSALCAALAFNAVHGAMAGLTAFSVGTVDGAAVWLPVTAIAGSPRRVDTTSRVYARLIGSTGQPSFE